MKIIHTADWHLGQHFMGKSREPEHQAFLDWLLKLIADQQVDALIIAGDLYDTGGPPSYARQLYNRFVVETLRIGCRLIVVSGNHDSVAMLDESADLLQYMSISQITRPSENPADQVVRVFSREDRTQPAALVCAIPFLRPQHVVKSTAGQDSAAKQLQLQTAIASHYQAVFQAAESLRSEHSWDCPIIATGHLTAMGAKASDSVRDIYIGTLEAFPADAFPPADYIALGHIHGAQKVAGSEMIRYSGSPIPLSFDESGNGKLKSVVLLTTGPASKIEPQVIPVPQYRSLNTIRGNLDSIEKQIVNLTANNNDADGNTTWLEIIVETQDYLTDLQQRVAGLLEGCNAEVLLLRRERKQNSTTLQTQQQPTLDELSIDEIFDYCLEESFSAQQMSNDESVQKENKQLQLRLKTLYQQVVSEVQAGDAP